MKQINWAMVAVILTILLSTAFQVYSYGRLNEKVAQCEISSANLQTEISGLRSELAKTNQLLYEINGRVKARNSEW